MKLKGCNNKIAPNIMIFIAAVAILLAVPIRTYQLVNIIEPETGFFVKQDPSVIILYVLLAVACLVLFIMSFICGLLPRPELPKQKNMVLTVFAILLAVAFVIDFGMQLSNFIKIVGLYDTSKIKGAMYFVKSGGGAVIVQSIFALLSSVYFVIFSISYIKGCSKFESFRVLALSPILWGLCRIIHRFIEPISFKNVSELIIQLFMIATMLMFFLAFARVASKVNHLESTWVIYGAGLSTAVLACTDTFSTLIVKVMGESNLLYSKYPLNVVDIFIALFVIVLVVEIMPTKSHLQKMRDENVELLNETADQE